MDLNSYSLEDLLLAAIKSEVDTKRIYEELSKKFKNAFLKDKLKFLSEEEEKHRAFIHYVYRKNFKDKEPILPKKNIVPLPRINSEGSASTIFQSAMDAELAAADFYNSLSEKFATAPEIKKTLQYLAVMEKGHYKLLEGEKDIIDRYEDFDTIWPMTHIGA